MIQINLYSSTVCSKSSFENKRSNISQNNINNVQEINPIIIIKYQGIELCHSDNSKSDVYDPMYNELFKKTIKLININEIKIKEKEHQRSYLFEYLQVEIWDNNVVKNADMEGKYGKKVGDARIQLICLKSESPYKYYDIININHHGFNYDYGRIKLGVSIVNDIDNMIEELNDFNPIELCNLYPPKKYKYYKHLYLDLESSSTCMLGSMYLPGPKLGEIVLEKFENVELNIFNGVSSFGDKYTIECQGILLLTDIRVIFLPTVIKIPYKNIITVPSPRNDEYYSYQSETQVELNSEEILAIRRATYQMPIGAIDDCKIVNKDSISAVIIIEAKDGSITEFYIHHKKEINKYTSRNQQEVIDEQRKYNIDYCAGLASDVIQPLVWCNKFLDQINWMIKEDMIWIRWMMYLKKTYDTYFPRSTGSFYSSGSFSLELDYYRLLAKSDNIWVLNDINRTYSFCHTYPSSIILPASLDKFDIELAGDERSKGRIPALVWLHPDTNVPLCRSAQPLAGLLGTAIAYDKKILLSIKHACPTNQPLRIADARPKINARANAANGKGFENVAYLGGASVAEIAFLNIDNIHVIRNSLAKVREGLLLYSSSDNTEEYEDSIHDSKWLHHLSSILKGAASVSESLLNGYPCLVHCSDGWDRTPQVTALSQLILDIKYRTINGFLTLINKEFILFGHMFEDRVCGKINGKETSPIFLQFLDCVYQLILQYPSDFEFTEYFLRIILQCSYSGLFSSFRGNSDCDRYQMIRNISQIDSIDYINFEFSSIFTYITMLIKIDSTNSLLINSFYKPPHHINSVYYIKPLTSICDMLIWKEGLIGFNQPFCRSNSITTPTKLECESSLALVTSKLLNFTNIHMNEFPQSVKNYINLMKPSKYDNIVSSIPYQIVNRNVIPFKRKNLIGLNGYKTININIRSAITIQTWYKSYRYSKIASKNIVNINEKQRKSLIKVLQIILFTEISLQIDIKYNLLFNKQKDMQLIVDELIHNVIVHCSRFDEYISKQHNNININQIHTDLFTKRKVYKSINNRNDQKNEGFIRISDERDTFTIENTDSSVSIKSKLISFLNNRIRNMK